MSSLNALALQTLLHLESTLLLDKLNYDLITGVIDWILSVDQSLFHTLYTPPIFPYSLSASYSYLGYSFILIYYTQLYTTLKVLELCRNWLVMHSEATLYEKNSEGGPYFPKYTPDLIKKDSHSKVTLTKNSIDFNFCTKMLIN